MKIQDIEDIHGRYLLSINSNKNDYPGQFIIGELFYQKIKSYIDLRPKNVITDRFFLYYSKGKCTSQPIGIHKIGEVPSNIASFIQLPDSKRYTGHCFRRTSATLLSDGGASMQQLKQLGRWRFDAIAQGYIENSLHNRQVIYEGITHQKNYTENTFSTISKTQMHATYSSTPTIDLPVLPVYVMSRLTTSADVQVKMSTDDGIVPAQKKPPTFTESRPSLTTAMQFTESSPSITTAFQESLYTNSRPSTSADMQVKTSTDNGIAPAQKKPPSFIESKPSTSTIIREPPYVNSNSSKSSDVQASTADGIVSDRMGPSSSTKLRLSTDAYEQVQGNINSSTCVILSDKKTADNAENMHLDWDDFTDDFDLTSLWQIPGNKKVYI